MKTGTNTPSTLALSVITCPVKKAQTVGVLATMSGLRAWKLHLQAAPAATHHITTMRTTGTTALENGKNGTTTEMTGASGLLKEMSRQ